MKQYPHLDTKSFSVNLDDLLSWPYWPNFIRIYSTLLCSNIRLCFALSILLCSGGSSKAKDGLPDNCKLACSCAISLLESVSQQLMQGCITFKELEDIDKNIGQMERLCDSVQNKTEKFVKGRVHTFVKLRLGEFQAFQEQLGHLQHLSLFVTPRVKGIYKNFTYT